jgi:uncharacterized protein YbaA (DUF1428 family)
MDKAGKYVDGFVAPVPKKNIEAYKQFSQKAGKVWKKHGALEYVECIGDDVKPGKVTSFPQAVKLEDDEVVVFSWIVYESREHRDRVMAAVMSDPRLKDMDPKSMPFDGMRMFFGGFNVLLAM